MSVALKQIIPPVLLGTAGIAYYTGPAGSGTSIHQATVCNTDAVNQTFSLHVVPEAGTAGDPNVFYKTKSLAPNEIFILAALVDHVVPPGAFISAVASVASKVVLCASGMVRTQ
jgi:hypothetical protein